LLPQGAIGEQVALANLRDNARDFLNRACAGVDVPRSECFNPIEMAISKLKSALRKLAERAVAGLIAILEGCAGLFKPAECKSYFEACGYDPAELPALDTT
jgi:hypothetical protein